MTGPGRYAPDPTEGITRVEDLPKAKIIRRQRSFKRRKCPRCGHRPRQVILVDHSHRPACAHTNGVV